jgi:hypothetical protein
MISQTIRRLLIAILLALPAGAQLYEDQLEPDELGIEELDSLKTPASTYVGVEACRPCHEAAYQKWLSTKHARTSVWLHTPMARTIAGRHGIRASSPDRSAVCLGCHGTAVDVPAAYRDPGFRIAEGVTCEKCHGPGGVHVHDPKVDLARPAEGFCAENCHRPKESHAIAGAKHLTHEQALAKIEHKEKKQQP